MIFNEVTRRQRGTYELGKKVSRALLEVSKAVKKLRSIFLLSRFFYFSLSSLLSFTGRSLANLTDHGYPRRFEARPSTGFVVASVSLLYRLVTVSYLKQ